MSASAASPALLTADQKTALLNAAFAPDCAGVLAAARLLGLCFRQLMHTLRTDAALATELQDAETLRQQAAREQLVRDAEDDAVPEKTRLSIRRDLAKKGSPLQTLRLPPPPDTVDALPPSFAAPAMLTESAVSQQSTGEPLRSVFSRPDWDAIQREIGESASPTGIGDRGTGIRTHAEHS